MAKITTQFESDAYTPDEVCRAMCDIDNSRCGKDIADINIRLEQHVELKAFDGFTYNDRRVLEHKRFDGLAANQSTGGMNRFLELSLANIRQQARPFDDDKKLNKDDLFLAEKIQPSSHGKFVKLWYTLTVNCNYGSICAEEPHCTIPLCITPPPLPNFGRVDAPAGWSPVLFNNFEFNLPAPGQIMAANFPTVAPVSGNFNFNVGPQEEVKMNFNVPVPVKAPQISFNADIPALVPMPVPVKAYPFKMNLQIDTDMINEEVPINPIPIPIPRVEIEHHDDVNAHPEYIEMNANFGMPGFPNMDMKIDRDVTTNATYTSETKVNGQTTSYTHVSSNDNPDSANVSMPVPIPVPMPVPAPVSVEANLDMNMGGNFTVSQNDFNVNVTTNLGVPSMNMDVNYDSDKF
jgi:hypothetical protein